MTMRDSIAAARISGPCCEADGAMACEFCFGADNLVFVGHFPAHPLLPGVFQLETTRAAAEWALQCPLALHEVSKAKFHRPILPAEIVRVELKWSETAGLIRVRTSFSVAGQRTGETTILLWRSG